MTSKCVQCGAKASVSSKEFKSNNTLHQTVEISCPSCGYRYSSSCVMSVRLNKEYSSELSDKPNDDIKDNRLTHERNSLLKNLGHDTQED